MRKSVTGSAVRCRSIQSRSRPRPRARPPIEGVAEPGHRGHPLEHRRAQLRRPGREEVRAVQQPVRRRAAPRRSRCPPCRRGRRRSARRRAGTSPARPDPPGPSRSRPSRPRAGRRTQRAASSSSSSRAGSTPWPTATKKPTSRQARSISAATASTDPPPRRPAVRRRSPARPARHLPSPRVDRRQEAAMAYAESVLDLIGDTPLVRLRRVIDRPGRGPGPGQGRVHEPGRLGEGPHRAPDGRRRRGERRAPARAARSSSRRAATPAWAWRSSPRTGATGAPSSAPTRSRATRSRCSGPTAPRWWCARPRSIPSHPDSYYSVSDRLVREIPRRLEARPVRQPAEPGLARGHHRPRDLGADRGPGHPLRGRHRHRRHDHRRRPLPEGRERRPGAGDRGRPRGLGVLRAAAAGRTWSRAWARTSGRPPSTRRSPTG